MEMKYNKTNEHLEISGMDLTRIRHKKSVYQGSFYVKEIHEDSGKMIVEYEEGDRYFIAYRDSIHAKKVGWKTPLVELVASFMKVAYLVSRGVIYQPLEDPDNFIYNVNRQRLQMGGRYDSTITSIDEDFLDWVLEFIGFTISEERPSNFGYITHKEYLDGMDEDRKELYLGYLGCKDFKDLVNYTLEPSIISALDDYLPIGREPIDNQPLIKEVINNSREEKEQILEEIALEDLQAQHEQELEEEELAEDLEVKKKRKFTDRKEKKKRDRRYKTNQLVLQQDKIDVYRKELGIPEDKEEYGTKRKGSQVIPTILSIAFLIFSIWIVYTFFMWMQ